MGNTSSGGSLTSLDQGQGIPEIIEVLKIDENDVIFEDEDDRRDEDEFDDDSLEEEEEKEGSIDQEELEFFDAKDDPKPSTVWKLSEEMFHP